MKLGILRQPFRQVARRLRAAWFQFATSPSRGGGSDWRGDADRKMLPSRAGRSVRCHASLAWTASSLANEQGTG